MEDNHVKKVSSIFRWLPRFNLKMLLIAFTIVGILLGFLGRHLYKARQQQMAVAKLTLAGATVRYESKFMRRFGPNILSDGTSETWSEGWDDWMAATFGKDAAYKVHSVYISAPGDEVKEIHKLPWLKELKVSADSASISLTDEAWSAVLQCVQIEKLSFKQAIHNPRGLAGLSKLSRLQHVVIDSGNMTIENSEEISQLKQLKHIDLILVGTSDEGLQPFAKLSALESLNLTHRGKSDSVTDRGVAFVSQLPALRSPLVDTRQTTVGHGQSLPEHRAFDTVGVIEPRPVIRTRY
jgi:hypothetical protein